jgi:replicative DNA helicase
MSNIQEDIFKNHTTGLLDVDYQEDFVAELIIDHKFGDSVIDLVETDNFETEALRSIVGIIKNVHEKYGKIPNFKDVSSEIKRLINNELNRDIQLAVVEQLKQYKGGDGLVQAKCRNFFLQQNMMKAVVKIVNIVSKGDVMEYYKCEELMRKTLINNNKEDVGEDLFDGLECVYEPDYRSPISLGLPGLDFILDGGVAPGEVMLLVAPTGTGKTTMSTFVANHIMRSDKKVLQIFFEDTAPQIKQKHAACLHNLDMSELKNNKEKCIALDKEYKEMWGGKLVLRRMKSGSTTIKDVRNLLNKLKTLGFIPDFLVFDYLDKLVLEKNQRAGSKYEAQDEITNQFLDLCEEFALPCLTFIQSNRSGIDKADVRVGDSGGSIGRAQMAHIVGTLSKTPDQKDTDLATIYLDKSRVGKTPWEFKDIYFSNSKVQIEIPLEMGKKQVNGLSFAFEQTNGTTIEQAMNKSREAFASKLLKKDNEESEQESNPTVSELENDLKMNNIKLEESFLNQKQHDDKDGTEGIPF